MGDKVIVNMNCTFVDNNRIDIGSNVLIAYNVQIYTATHSTKVDERMVQDLSLIHISSVVWTVLSKAIYFFGKQAIG